MASFLFYGITCLIRLIEFDPKFLTFEEHICVRQVLSDKWFPLRRSRLPLRGALPARPGHETSRSRAQETACCRGAWVWPARFGTGLLGTYLNGYLVLQAKIHFRTAQIKQFLKLLARKRLGTVGPSTRLAGAERWPPTSAPGQAAFRCRHGGSDADCEGAGGSQGEGAGGAQGEVAGTSCPS